MSRGISVVGIDLGGTKVAAAAMRDRVLAQACVEPTALSSSDALVEQLVGIVGRARGDGPLDAVGVGVPSVIEFATGRIVSSVNIPLADVPLRSVLGSALGVPVYVDNDATVAALAEAHDEQLNLVAHNLVMFTIGTGVGGGIVLGGRIYRGATGGAGEIGHTLVSVPVEPDVPGAGSFPQHGSLEAVGSGHALDRIAERVAREHPDSALGRLARGERVVSGVDAVAAAREGDGPAAAAVRRWARAIGLGVANAINTFDPEEVVIGGGAAAAGELVLEPARAVAQAYIHPGLRGHATVRLARHGVRAGVLGAALLAEQELRHGGLGGEAPPAGAVVGAGAAASAADERGGVAA